jgi:hypothetical protein
MDLNPEPDPRLRCTCHAMGSDCTARATAEDQRCTACRTGCGMAGRADGTADWVHFVGGGFHFDLGPLPIEVA